MLQDATLANRHLKRQNHVFDQTDKTNVKTALIHVQHIYITYLHLKLYVIGTIQSNRQFHNCFSYRNYSQKFHHALKSEYFRDSA